MEAASSQLNEYKEQLFDQFGRLGRALASPRRLELLDLLCQAERTVEDLIKHTGLTASNVSQHLSVLKQSRLVTARKEGLFVYYRLADPVIAQFWRMFRRVATQCLAEVREVVHAYMDVSDDAEPIDLARLRERLRRREIVLLDVRPEVEYQAAHIPDSLSIPLDELESRLHELPTDREIVAYCRGPFCAMALEAVRILKRHGFNSGRIEDGLLEWRDQGWPVESSHPELGSHSGSQP